MNILKSYFILSCIGGIFQIGTVTDLHGQNIIQNPSFEDTIPCSVSPDPYSPETCYNWLSVCQSPDYCSEIYCGNYYIPFGSQIPRTGSAMVGSGIYDEYDPLGIREVFGQQLSDTLTAGHMYCVSFYVSLAEESNFAVDRIGALFTSYQINGNDVFSFTLTPQVENTPGNIISDTTNWVLVSGDFIAQGNETFVSLGNFYNNLNTQSIQLPFGDTTFKFAYYYIDDISVTDCTVGLEELSGINKIQLSPNPATSQIKISLPNSNAFDLEVYDITGKLVYKNHEQPSKNEIAISTSNFADGLYLLRYRQGEMSGNSKFVIQH